jgi:drug/metabolite transporter (DMT)-like permease
MTHFIAFICVVGIAAGQILFKLSANSMQRTGSLLDMGTLLLLASAFSLYGITTIGWVWVLQKVALGQVYPIMALSFVLVPLASHFFFGERFHVQYFVGVTLIVIGIIVAVRT